MARVLVLAMHHFDTIGHPGSSHSGIEIYIHTWDGAFLATYKQGRQGAASVVVADSALS